jgi:hypothetical protein
VGRERERECYRGKEWDRGGERVRGREIIRREVESNIKRE